jgi:hypothetical protein
LSLSAESISHSQQCFSLIKISQQYFLPCNNFSRAAVTEQDERKYNLSKQHYLFACSLAGCLRSCGYPIIYEHYFLSERDEASQASDEDQKIDGGSDGVQYMCCSAEKN